MSQTMKSILTTEHKLSLAQSFVSSHTENNDLYATIGRTRQWEETYEISNITQSSPAVVTSYFHGLSDGDVITITGVVGMTQINNELVPYIVQNVTQNTFELKSIDSSSFNAYVSGGIIHKDLETNIPAPIDDADFIIESRRKIIGAKRIDGSFMKPVIPRYNWKSGETYDFYNPYDENLPNKRFYVLTDDNNLYKCLWNGGNVPSTIKPTSTSLTPFVTSDGYKWKFMKTLTATDTLRFLSVNWIPVDTLKFDDGSLQWDVQESAVKGTIDAINLEEPGSGYVDGTVTVTIEGDGTGATAVIPPGGIDASGSILKIEIVNPGSGYSWAQVNIETTSPGIGARAQAIIAPGNGHGSDPRKELFAYHVMVDVEFNGDETDSFMIDNDFRQVMLVSEFKEKTGIDATNTVYDVRNRIDLTNVVNQFQIDEVVSGVNSGARATITNVGVDQIFVSDVIGTFIPGETITTDSGAQGVVNSVEISSLDVFSGSVIYIANLQKISRTETQTEKFKIILEF